MRRREFQFTEGRSRKFWAIEVDGPRFTVRFGRLGTAGQAQTKEFGSDAEALKAADKLIAEKTKKGYAEAGAAAPPVAPAKAAAPAPPPAPAGAATLEIVRRVDAVPPPWMRRPDQPWVPQPRPAQPPFDLKDTLDQLGRSIRGQALWVPNWGERWIGLGLTPGEARYWFEVMTRTQAYLKATKMLAELRKIDYDKALTRKQVVDRLSGPGGCSPPQMAPVLAGLLPLTEVVGLILMKKAPSSNPGLQYRLLIGLRRYILPYLTEPEAEELRGAVRDRLDPNDTEEAGWHAWCLAAYLGMHEELPAYAAARKDGEFEHYGQFYQGECWDTPHLIIFNLPDYRQVESETRRLKLPLRAADAITAWLVHTQWHALGLPRDGILATTDKARAERMTKALAQANAPELAPVMLQLARESKAVASARQWLEDNPGNAIAGLIPAAAGEGKLAEAAVEHLREATKKGHGEFIEEQLQSAAPEVAVKVRQAILGHEEKTYPALDAKTTPRWLKQALSAAPPAKLPGFVRPTRLPPVLIDRRRLSDEHLLALLAALKASPLGSPPPLAAALKQQADRAALDAFAWKLFEQWLAEGAPSKEKWAFLALGHLGGDAVALKLTPLVRAWPGESQHQRAVTGLECLRAIGTDTALMQLNGIAQKLKFQGLKNKAKEFMEAIAKDKGLSRDQLEDRIVPDLGLDQRGTRVFDFGPRRFEVVLGPDLKPLVRDDERKLRDDLPKPGTKDDAGKANAAVAEWKVLKKALREAVKVQAFRLEQAMVVGRRWAPDEFRTLLVRHPLMVNLVRRLLWGGHDAKGKLVRTFRVTEEGEYADAEDRPRTLDGLASVGVVHPLHLSEEERSKWGQVFGDYEVIAPFPQLGRPVYSLEKAEAKAKEIKRFAGKKVPATTLWGTLERLGWVRGAPGDGGMVHEHSKSFPAAGVTAVLGYEEGVAVGFMQGWGDQKLEGVFFVKTAERQSWFERKKALVLGQLDAVVLSEVLADLTLLASKAG
jgi:predicted DNA-binding WGR domain protein